MGGGARRTRQRAVLDMKKGPARIPAERAGPRKRSVSGAGSGGEPRRRPAAAGHPRETLTCLAEDPRQADATPDLARPRRPAGPCRTLESALRHAALAVLFHEPEVSRRIHDLHLGTPRFPCRLGGPRSLMTTYGPRPGPDIARPCDAWQVWPFISPLGGRRRPLGGS